MARPGSVPTWATNANYTSGPAGVIGTATKTAPTAPISTDGWKPADKAAAQNLNYILNLIGAWLVWLSSNIWDGLITFVDAIQFNSLITAKSGLTCDANQHVTVSGTGLFKHGTQTLLLPGTAFLFGGQNGDNNVQYGSTDGTINSINTFPFSLNAPIPLPVGKRITAIRARVKDSATGPTQLRFRLIENLNFGTLTTVGTSGTSAGSGAGQTLSIASLTKTLLAAAQYTLYVDTTTGTAGGCIVYGAEVDYDQQ